MTEKLLTDTDEILKVVTRMTAKHLCPLTASDIIRTLAPDAGTVAEAQRSVHTPAVTAALTALTDAERLVAHTGREWLSDYGVDFYGRRATRIYYAPRADAARWEKDHRTRTKSAAQAQVYAQAHAYALSRIREDHPELLDTYLAEFNARNTGS